MAASLETRNLVGSALAALLAGAAFLAMFQALQRTERVVRARSQINLALHALDQGLSSLKDAETSQRGFLLTGRENYLGPYDSGRREARASLEAFQALEVARTFPVEDPVEDIDQLKALTEAKLGELARTVQLAQSGKREREGL